LTRPEAPFDEPWQAQAFALAVALSARGAFAWSEFSQALGAAIAAAPDAPYYEAWLKALEGLAAGKGMVTAPEMRARKHAWEHAYLTTPHGQPVEL
jgi:nitrile hydratase accessory protein